MNNFYISGAVLRTKKQDFKVPHADFDLHLFYKTEIAPHSHDYYELFLITKGKIQHILDNDPKVLQTMDLAIVSPYQTHQFTQYKDYSSEHLNLSVSKEKLQSLINNTKKNPPISLELFCQNTYYSLDTVSFNYIDRLTEQFNMLESPLSFASAEALFNQIFSSILFNAVPKKSNDEIPKYLITFTNELSSPANFQKPLSTLYPSMPYSQPVLNRLFKQYYGQTIISYFTEQKIIYACNLLKNTNYSYLKISNLLGFKSQNHFSQVFKKQMKISPTQYKNKIID